MMNWSGYYILVMLFIVVLIMSCHVIRVTKQVIYKTMSCGRVKIMKKVVVGKK